MPICPYCSQEIIRLYSSLRITMQWQNKTWVVNNQNGENTAECPECKKEFGPQDLDELSVPTEMR